MDFQLLFLLSSTMVRVKNGLDGRGGDYSSCGNRGCGSRFVNEGTNHREQRKASTPVEVAFYQCKTKPNEMIHHITMRGMQLSNFA